MKSKKKKLKTNLKILLKRIVSLFLISYSVFSLEVTHQIRPGSTFESTSLSQSCSTMEGMSYSNRCNPALFPYSTRETVALDVVLKSEGDSVNNGKDLIFDPITEVLIRRLFEESNFNSFTFDGNIAFKNSYFEITYEPYYLLADLFIFNPAFPEISVNIVNRETISLKSGREILNNDFFKLSTGLNIYYYQHQYENTSFSLFDLSFKKPEELINFKSIYGVAGDLGFFLNPKSELLPKLSLQVKNINSEVKENSHVSSSEFLQQTLLLFDTYSVLSAGKNVNTFLGRFDFNVDLPFLRYFEELYPRGISVGMRYSLNFFSVLLGYNKYYHNLGLKFDSENFNIGLMFTREKDLGKFQRKFQESVYTGIEIVF